MFNKNEILRLNLVLGPANKRELISHGVKLYNFSILSLICAAVLHENMYLSLFAKKSVILQYNLAANTTHSFG